MMSIHQEQGTRNKELRTILWAAIAFAACSAAAGIKSPGFLEADGCSHYLDARRAWGNPRFFTDVWGRPLCTALYCVPAHFGGVVGVRLTSLAVAIGIALVARAIARGQGYRHPELAMILTLGQPLLFLHSFSELTELPFALVMGIGLLAYQRRKWWLVAVMAMIGPMGRPEGFVLLLPVAFALVTHRKWGWALLLPLGLIAWSAAGRVLDPEAHGAWWRWLPEHWPYEAKSEYKPGRITHFLELLPMIVGPFALPAVWIGVLNTFREFGWVKSLVAEHRARVDALIAAIPLGMLVGHSFLYWLGRLSSNGEMRYLLVAAPMWGLLAARGWEWAFERFRWPRPASWAALAVVAPGMVNFYWRVVPLRLADDWIKVKDFLVWYAQNPIHEKYPHLLCDHPAVNYFLDEKPLAWDNNVDWSPYVLAHPPAGTLLLWDPVYSVFNSDSEMVEKLPRVMSDGWINDWKSEWKSKINDPPPWPTYQALDPHDELIKVPLPPDRIPFQLPWHLFLTSTDDAGNPTRSASRSEAGMAWSEVPGNPTATMHVGQ